MKHSRIVCFLLLLLTSMSAFAGDITRAVIAQDLGKLDSLLHNGDFTQEEQRDDLREAFYGLAWISELTDDHRKLLSVFLKPERNRIRAIIGFGSTEKYNREVATILVDALLRFEKTEDPTFAENALKIGIQEDNVDVYQRYRKFATRMPAYQIFGDIFRAGAQKCGLIFAKDRGAVFIGLQGSPLYARAIMIRRAAEFVRENLRTALTKDEALTIARNLAKQHKMNRTAGSLKEVGEALVYLGQLAMPSSNEPDGDSYTPASPVSKPLSLKTLIEGGVFKDCTIELQEYIQKNIKEIDSKLAAKFAVAQSVALTEQLEKVREARAVQQNIEETFNELLTLKGSPSGDSSDLLSSPHSMQRSSRASSVSKRDTSAGAFNTMPRKFPDGTVPKVLVLHHHTMRVPSDGNSPNGSRAPSRKTSEADQRSESGDRKDDGKSS